jgi:hypothetical protein
MDFREEVLTVLLLKDISLGEYLYEILVGLLQSSENINTPSVIVNNVPKTTI